MPQWSELFVEVPITSVIATFVGGRGDCAVVEAPGAASLLGVRVACPLPCPRGQQCRGKASRERGLLALGPGSAIYHCMNLGKLFNLSVLYFPHLEDGDDNSTYHRAFVRIE